MLSFRQAAATGAVAALLVCALLVLFPEAWPSGRSWAFSSRVVPGADASVSEVDAGPPGATEPPGNLPPRSMMPTAPLAETRGLLPHASLRLTAPRLIAVGTVLGPGVEEPSRVVVATADGRGSLVDVHTGKTLARFGKPDRVAPRAGVVVLEHDKGKARLVRLRDGKFVEPRLDGALPKLKDTFWCAKAELEAVVLAIEAEDGSKWYGVPSDASFESFAVRPLPFATSAALSLACEPNPTGAWDFFVGDEHGVRFGGTRETPYFLPHDAGCVRARLEPGAAPTCVEYDPAVDGGQTSLPQTRWSVDGWVLGADWFAHESWDRIRFYEEAIGDPPTARMSPGCQTHFIMTRLPRAFVVCKRFDDDGGFRTSATALITPDAVLRLEDDRVPENFVGGLLGADPLPVIPHADHSKGDSFGAASAVETWIDLVRGKAWTTPPLHPLGVAAFAGVRDRSFAVDVAKPGDVWVLDFAQGTRDFFGTVVDCPGELSEIGEGDDPLVLACTTHPAAGTVDTRLIWADIVDREGYERYRTTLYPELFLRDGTVVLTSSRTREAEREVASGRIFAAELPPP